jgi:hypothetical protein
MHVPLPFSAIARRVRSGYSYFRTGVHIEGRAHLCDDEHLQIWVGGQPTRKVPQHVDVTAKLWNRRGERVTAIEIARAVIPAYSVELTPADMWPDFKPVTLEPGAAPLEASFVLAPKNDPKGRVEAAVGAWLEVEFRPSRGSERRARPRLRCQLGPGDATD